MKNTPYMVALAVVVAGGVGCKKGNDAKAKSPTPPTKKVAQKLEKDDGAPEKPKPKPNSESGMVGKTTWEMTVTGFDIPKAAGAMVVAQDFGGQGSHYQFIGGRSMIQMDIKGVKPWKPGTYEPFDFSLNFIKLRKNCSSSELAKGKKLKIVIKDDGTGTVEGPVSCGTIGEKGNKKDATIKGWFKK